MINKIFLYVIGAITAVAITSYMIVAIRYYITQLIEVSNIKNLIEEIQHEYDLEITKLFSRMEHGEIDMDQLVEKECFITNLYAQMFSDLEEKFVKKYNKERIRLK